MPEQALELSTGITANSINVEVWYDGYDDDDYELEYDVMELVLWSDEGINVHNGHDVINAAISRLNIRESVTLRVAVDGEQVVGRHSPTPDGYSLTTWRVPEE